MYRTVGHFQGRMKFHEFCDFVTTWRKFSLQNARFLAIRESFLKNFPLYDIFCAMVEVISTVLNTT